MYARILYYNPVWENHQEGKSVKKRFVVTISFSAAKAAQGVQMSVRPFVRSSGYFNFDSL